MRIFRTLGLPKMAARSNAAVYGRSGAIAAVVLDRTEPEDYLSAGRCMQRIWLEATHEGLAAQPLAGLLYLAQYADRTSDPDISPKLRVRIRSANDAIHDIAAPHGGVIAMLLRIGRPIAPATARTKRRAPKII